MSARPLHLLTLPNEILLAVVARIPYSRGERITTLRLVNHQLRDLLSNDANLKQLRIDIAEVQFPVAHALHILEDNNNDHGWKSLQGLEDDTSMVQQMLQKIQTTLIDDLSGSPDQLSEELQDLHLGGGRLDVGAQETTQLLFLGLNVFASLSHARINVLDEKEATHWMMSLGVGLASVLRFTSLKIVQYLRQLSGKTPVNALSSSYRSLFSSKASAAMEELLVGKGLQAVSHLFRSGKNVGPDLLRFSKTFIDDIRRIELSFPFILCLGQYLFWKSQLPVTPGGPTTFGRHPSLGVITNNLLVSDIWTRVLGEFEGSCERLYGGLFEFIFRGRCVNQEAASRIFEQLSPSETVAVTNHDWYGFVDENLQRCISGTRESLLTTDGVSAAVKKAIRRGFAEATRHQAWKEAQSKPFVLPPHFTYLCIWDHWKD